MGVSKFNEEWLHVEAVDGEPRVVCAQPNRHPYVIATSHTMSPAVVIRWYYIQENQHNRWSAETIQRLVREAQELGVSFEHYPQLHGFIA